MKQEHQPIIPHHQSLPEITIRGTVIALILTVLLAASNIYLGLQAGITISASIPAAVMSMGILHWFKHSNILENNIVQTCVSSGEGTASGIIFALPAVLILKFWLHFDYFDTVVISLTGGLMGVLFSIPLRPILLADKTLRFPEGVAIAKVLQAGSDKSSASFNYLLQGGLVGAFISLCQQGFQVMTDSAGLWFTKGKVLFGASLGFSPALIAAGYIIGVTSAVSILIGIIVTWIIGIPILSAYYGDAVGHGVGAAMSIWSQHIRYMGVGTLLAGGVWTICKLVKPISLGLHKAFVSLKSVHDVETIRTERDIKINKVMWMVGLMAIPVMMLIWYFIQRADLGLSVGMTIILFVVLSIMVLLLQFVVSALCGYFSGLVGASSNPLSAIAISAAILIGLVILGFLSPHSHVPASHAHNIQIAGLAIILLSLATAVGGIATDTMQDLKAGQLVGATPWKQQAMLFLGVTVTSLIIPPILNLLLNAYGIGGVFPHAGTDHTHSLAAPQATLMASIIQGIFSHNLNWSMILVGVALAVVCIIADMLVGRKGYRIHALAVGLGVYLPIMTSSCLVIGGIMSYVVERKLAQRGNGHDAQQTVQTGRQSATILGGGMIAGATLMGVLLAIPFVIYGSSDALVIMPASLLGVAKILGLLSALLVVAWLYFTATKKR